MDDALRKIEMECVNALREAIMDAFPELKTVSAALPIVCFREIASILPDTLAKLKEVEHMTEARVDRYGAIICRVCKAHIKKRTAYLNSLPPRQDDTLRQIEMDCFNALKEAIIDAFPDLKSVYSALPVSCYRGIASTLPDTPAKLMKVELMTEGRVNKYGAIIFRVCKAHIEKRMAYLNSLSPRQDDTLLQIEMDCFNALKEAIMDAFPELKSVYSALPISCYRGIASTLPDTLSKLKKVELMTEGRVNKYGAIIIRVCKAHIEKRIAYLNGLPPFWPHI